MTGAGGIAREVVGALGTSLLFGTALAAAAWLLSVTLLRRARPAVIAALWTVVLLKFLVPVGPGATYSLASLVDRVTSDAPAAQPVVVTAPPAGARLAPEVAATLPWGTMALAGVWLAVVAALAVRQARRAGAARRRALAADPAPAWLVDEAAAIARDLGLRRAARRVELRVSATDGAPYLVGLVRPIVVLPLPLTERTESKGAARRAALAHELAHVRRGDALLRLVQAAAATLFFFWPVVRFASRRLDLAREQACDAWAVAVGPLSARDYARMLVDAARTNAVPAAGLALARRGGHLRRRVDALCARPPGAGTGLVGAAAIAGFALLGLTGAAPASATAAHAKAKVCIFTPEVASSIMASFPEADVDGDGALSRAEVCEFQQVMRRRMVADPIAAAAETEVLASVIGEGGVLASEGLCCECPEPSAFDGPSLPTCSRGVDP